MDTTKLVTSLLVLSLAGVLAGCKDDKTKTSNTATPTPSTPTPETPNACFNAELAEEYGITSIPEGKDDALKQSFCKYMAIQAPNGKEIEIVAQSDISDDQMIRAHNILSFYLENVSGTAYGEDKSEVANAMANNGARLLLLNGSDDGTNDPTVDGQPLYDSELIVEGTAAYINNDYENHRDAAFEEILHLMHDYGIGTSGLSTPAGALPAYMKEIDAARENAMNNYLWPTANIDAGTTAWIEELRAEGSLSQEYLASVIDSAYGYWGANTEIQGGMGGIYIAKTREDVASKDPMGMALVQGYFSPEVTYMARIDSEFQGDFSLTFDVNFPYTYKSQYLINAQLTGSLDSNLVGNENDNILSGNSGTNTLDGKGGDDIALFKGEYSQYSVSVSGDNIIVQDSHANRDGVVTLISIEALQFAETLYLFEDGELIAASDDGSVGDNDSRIGGCIQTKPNANTPSNLYQTTAILHSSTFSPFTKQQTAYGIKLVADGAIDDSYIQRIATTIEEIFSQNEALDLDMQSKVLENMYAYNTLIPVVNGDLETAPSGTEALLQSMGEENSVCDIIMSGPAHSKAMEVVEHVLHHITDIGLHYTFPDEWAISKASDLYKLMQQAISEGFYDVSGYADIKAGDESAYDRIIMQEFAYWLITTQWNLQELYGPNESEWTIKNATELAEKFPLGHNLLENTVNTVMVAPSLRTLEGFGS